MSPTPEQILSDGVVTASEYRAAIDKVSDCVRAQCGEFEAVLDVDGTPSFITSGPAGLNVVVEACASRHVGRIELVWADQVGPTPEEDAAFYDHSGWATWERLPAWLADQRTTFLAAPIQSTAFATSGTPTRRYGR